MTRVQLAGSEAYRCHYAAVFGCDNVRFIEGYIERLDESGLEGDSFDVIVSNCVLNLSPDKDAVLAGAHRLLKDGGEFYFSGVYADRRVSDESRQDPVFYAECLGGAPYWTDSLRRALRTDFPLPPIVV